jgi:hypothetical protein
MRQPLLVIVLCLIGLLTYGTVDDAAKNGVSVLTVLSVLVLALFAFGIVGALREPPE